MKCRGREKREWIVENYDVEPIAHIQLLNGQTKYSDAERPIENDYYIFKAISKKDIEEETIICGMGAARHFLKLINHEGLPIFNPLVGENHKNGDHNVNATIKQNDNERWNPVAQQLYNAIMWIILIIDAKPQTPIYDIKETVLKYKTYAPYDLTIKKVNTIISRCFENTLTEEIEKLKENNNIREELCNFDLLIARCDHMKTKDNKNYAIIPWF